MKKELAELNFKQLIDYPEVTGYSNQKPYKCNGFCTDCEQKGLLVEGEKLERISHGADSSDFKSIIGKEYSNNLPVMFIMRDPSPKTQPFFTTFEHNGIEKEVPSKAYYWVTDYVTKPVTREAIMNGSVYDLYFWYLQEKFSLNNIYITNMIKCYSPMYKTKTPNYKIQSNCIEQFLLKEIELFKPTIIFCLDSKVHYVLTHNPIVRTKIQQLGDILVVKLKHPSLVESYNKNKEAYLDGNDKIIANALNLL